MRSIKLSRKIQVILLFCLGVILVSAVVFYVKDNDKMMSMSVNDIDNIEIISEGDRVDANSILRISLHLDGSYQYAGYMLGNDENGDLDIQLYKERSSSTDTTEYIDIPLDILNQDGFENFEKIFIVNEQMEKIREVKL